MTYRYEFIGGHLNGRKMSRKDVEHIASGHRPSFAQARAQGALVPREELDGQPTVHGYLGPMWDGTRYEGTKAGLEPLGILRYETLEVYNMMSE